MIKALQRAPHVTSARLIGSEVESCFRIGNQRQKEPSGAEWHGLSVGTKALSWLATEVPTSQHQDQIPWVWLTPGPEPEGLTRRVTCAVLKSLSGSEEDSLLQGPVLRKLPLEREQAQ